MGRLATPWIFYNDSVGRTLPYSKLYFYSTGTTTPKNTYSDVGLTQVNPNPLTADASGVFTDIFLTTGGYTIQLRDRDGNILRTQDDVYRTLDGNDGANFDASIAALEAEDIVLAADIAALDSRLTTAEGDINTLQADVIAVETTADGLKVGTYNPNRISGGLISNTFLPQDMLISTISAAAPPVVTYNSDYVQTGDLIYIEESGVPAFDQRYYRVTRTGVSTLTLDGEPNRGASAGAFGSSNYGTTNKLSVGAVQCTDSTNSVLMIGSSSSFDQDNWTAPADGNGKASAAAMANDTWYSVYAIYKDSTGDVSYCFAVTSGGFVSNAAMTAWNGGVAPKYRRIGYRKTQSASTNWKMCHQDTNDPEVTYFSSAQIPTYSLNNPGTNTVLFDTGAPPNTLAILSINLIDTAASASTAKYMWLATTNHVAPATINVSTATLATTQTGVANDDVNTNFVMRMMTDYRGYIAYKLSASSTDITVNINTLGWVDNRGIV